jgi:hypothetical protein
MEFRYVRPYRDKGEGYPEATANTIYTDLGVGTPTSHFFGEGNVASSIIHCGHRLQDNGLSKDDGGEALKGILPRINTLRFHTVEGFAVTHFFRTSPLPELPRLLPQSNTSRLLRSLAPAPLEGIAGCRRYGVTARPLWAVHTGKPRARPPEPATNRSPPEPAQARAITDPRPDADNQGEGGAYPTNKARLNYPQFVALQTN